MSHWHKAAFLVHGIEDPYLKSENLGVYGIETLAGIPDDQFYAKMGYEFWANLPRTEEFDVFLSILELFFTQENICVLTAPPRVKCPGCLEGKEDWIYKNLPQYKDQFLIGRPKDFCAGPDTLLVDDSDANVRAFVKRGGRYILIPRAWNALYMNRFSPVRHLCNCLGKL